MTYNTGKRQKIIALLQGSPEKSFTVREISDVILEGGGGRSTVHRIVSHLADEGVLRRVASSRGGAPEYQYIGGACRQHLHLMCRECGRLSHLDRETSRDLEDKIMHTAGFSLESGAVLLGICHDCDLGKEVKNA